MTYVITAGCVDHLDQLCVEVCPVDAIAHEPGIDRKAYVDPEGCVDCGACERACPQGAIVPMGKLRPEWRAYAEIDRGWWIDPDWARAAVDALVA